MDVGKNNPTLLLIGDAAYFKHLSLPRKDQLLLDLFWLGFMLYTIGYAVAQTTYVNWIVCQAFQSLGLALFWAGLFPQLRFAFDNFYLRVLFVLYFVWLMGVIARGITFDYDLIKGMLFDAWFGVFLYFTPLLLLFPKNLFFYKRLFDVILLLGLVFLGLSAIFAREIIFADRDNLISRTIVEIFTRTLAMPTTFILLTFIYHSNKRKILALIIVLTIILLAILKARRGLLFMASVPLVLAYFVYLYQSKARVLVIGFSLVCCGALFVYGWSIAQEGTLFTYLKDRGLEDTRSNVELCFYRDMTTQDWLIGKGLLGEYYCPGIDPDNRTGFRNVIETDYLQIILKGGLISFGLLLLIALPAAFLGIFASKNLFAKAAGFWIVFALINMYPSTVNTFTLNYLLVWIAVGIGYSKAIRMLPDEVLKLYFNPSPS
ncbi:hypothetical protein [Haliscomenobacter sp.]|uniref:hypothetical protein n=1 Tax=Haliscomenobacter sp. TaxID=2717303 RepID=UPI00359352A2